MSTGESADGTLVEFTWDPVKAASNVAKHGVAFAQAATVLADALALTVFDAEHSEFEERWFTLGMSSEGELLAVSHTFTAIGPASARVRVISAREATRNERRQYENKPR
ncbi:MAG: BrnT family toxin [Chloroflexota bacterium]